MVKSETTETLICLSFLAADLNLGRSGEERKEVPENTRFVWTIGAAQRQFRGMARKLRVLWPKWTGRWGVTMADRSDERARNRRPKEN